jgi:Flp pilus assembly protein TadD
MKTILIALLLQSAILPPRTTIENPAVTFAVPRELKKDYDKAWARFLTGKDDSKVRKDVQNLLKKNQNFDAGLLVLALLDLVGGKNIDAELKLTQLLDRHPNQPNQKVPLSYLADLAFARGDYARASDLYGRLLAVDPTRIDVETKRQKALLLATENLLRTASNLQGENRLTEAEGFYRQALQIAPQEPVLHAEIGVLLIREKKWDEALVHFRREAELAGPNVENQKNMAEALMNLERTEEARAVLDRLRSLGGRPEEQARLQSQVKELENLGRWGKDIEQFHSIEKSTALKREQLAAVFTRYFPQIAEFRQTPQIITDLQGTWASPEIQTVVGVGLIDAYPNHTFRPDGVVSRGEFAASLARLSRLLGLSETGAPLIPTSTLASGNPLYRDIQLVLSHSLMTLDDAGNFQIDRPVSGEEAVSAVEQLLHLTRTTPA